jgi:hypothetical protein
VGVRLTLARPTKIEQSPRFTPLDTHPGSLANQLGMVAGEVLKCCWHVSKLYFPQTIERMKMHLWLFTLIHFLYICFILKERLECFKNASSFYSRLQHFFDFGVDFCHTIQRLFFAFFAIVRSLFNVLIPSSALEKYLPMFTPPWVATALASKRPTAMLVNPLLHLAWSKLTCRTTGFHHCTTKHRMAALLMLISKVA